MSSTDIPALRPGMGINAEIAASRAHTMVVRNSRFLIGVTLASALFSAPMAVCMVLVAISQIFPLSAFTFGRLMSALTWATSGLAMGSACPWLWNLGRALSFYEVRLDLRGADFRLGTKKKPQELLLAWDKIAAITRRREGNNMIFTVSGNDVSEVTYSSYTFFRPMKLAKLIAARSGVAIQKA